MPVDRLCAPAFSVLGTQPAFCRWVLWNSFASKCRCSPLGRSIPIAIKRTFIEKAGSILWSIEPVQKVLWGRAAARRTFP